MAERRMFAKTIIDSDAFLDMPITSQLLYFHLAMRADDDGFVNKPKAIMRTCSCKDDDLRLLFTKKFLIPFDSGVVVIKHWKIHNYIAKDRYTETKYKEEKAMLSLDENKAYTTCIQPVYEPETQARLGKVSLSKNNIYTPELPEEEPEKEPDKDQKKEIYQAIISYLNEKAGTNYRASSAKTKTVIHARLAEGFSLEDFKTVIDNKCADWLGDEKMEKYLRPETLFGTKFEGYLNSKVTRKAANINMDQDDLDDIF